MWVKEPRKKDGAGTERKDRITLPLLQLKEQLPVKDKYQGLFGSSGDKNEE